MAEGPFKMSVERQKYSYFPFDDEGLRTISSRETFDTELACCALLNEFYLTGGVRALEREAHTAYFVKGLTTAMGKDYCGYDASRVWLVYWCLQGLDLLGALDGGKDEIPYILERCVDFLSRCQAPSGGFGGGPQQEAHMASTYAAVMSLLIIGTPAALATPNRLSLQAFLSRLKASGGGAAFSVTRDGECDTRASYTALSTASALGLLTPALTAGSADFLAACQSPEGGFGGEPGNEAHGGYTYCALAALLILEREWGKTAGASFPSPLQRCDLSALSRWLSRRQVDTVGGFSGRTNKLVDVCYSFWAGASCALLVQASSSSSSSSLPAAALAANPLPSPSHAQAYVLDVSQQPMAFMTNPQGGCRDKPAKPPDYYHTCYALSGLSVAQWGWGTSQVMGGDSNQLLQTDPVYNIRPCRLAAAREYYASHPLPRLESE